MELEDGILFKNLISCKEHEGTMTNVTSGVIFWKTQFIGQKKSA